MLLDLSVPCTQSTFGGVVGIAQPAVATLLAAGVLPPAGTAGEWLGAYAQHLRDLAHGRAGTVADSRRRVLDAQATRLELENRRTAGELCRVDDVRLAGARVGAALVQELDSLGARLAPLLVNRGLSEIARALNDEQRALRLRVLAVVERQADTPAGRAVEAMAPSPAEAPHE